MSSIIEGGSTNNDDLIKRLHGIIRPFVLRRLKKDVETQMPGKYEHIVKCMLSRRQVRNTHNAVFPLLGMHFSTLTVDVSVRRVYG